MFTSAYIIFLGHTVECNGALSIDNFNQTENKWNAKILSQSKRNSKISEIKSTCQFIDPNNNTHSMFDYQFLIFDMETFKLSEPEIETKTSSLSTGVVGVAVGIVLFSGFIFIGYRHRYLQLGTDRALPEINWVLELWKCHREILYFRQVEQGVFFILLPMLFWHI